MGSGDDPVLGIDLGTTNSVVAVANGEEVRVITTDLGNRLIPSVVSFRPDGAVLVGEEARERRLIDAANTVYSVKRLIGRPFSSPEVSQAQQRFAFELVKSPNGAVLVDIRGETYTLTEISAFVLRELRRLATERLGRSVERAVITVPASFNELQRSATKAAARVAGLEVARIINEPTAAALAYGLGKAQAERVAVYDLGGGTFDLTLLELEGDVFEVVGTAGDSFLGGDDLDLVMAEVMCEASLAQHRFDPRTDDQAYERLRAADEWAKCQLSENDAVEVVVEELSYGRGGKALDLDFRMERSDFEDRVRPLLARTFDVCNVAMDEASLRARDIDAVVLVGGSTRVPLVRQMVSQFFGKEPRTHIDPDLVVGQGAAIHGFALMGRPKRKAKTSLGKLSLRKVSAAELARLKREREKRQAELPKQPAFAPTAQVDLPPEALVGAVMPKSPAELGGMPGIVLAGGVVEESRAKLPDPRREPTASFRQGSTARNDERTVQQPLPGKTTIHGMPAAPPPLPPALPPALPPTKPVLASDIPSLPPDAFDLEVPDSPSSEGLPGLVIEVDDDDEPASIEIAQSLAVGLGFGLEVGDSPPEANEGGLPAVLAGFVEPLSGPSPLAPPPPPAAMLLPDADMPLLMDVTPHALCIETAGGYCQQLIRRNVPVPVEQARVFSTGSDGQESVAIRICQGEAQRFTENQPLGEIELRGLRSAPRGDVKIDVTFIMDASGTLSVKASDISTGRAQEIRIQLLGGASEEDIESMRRRQQGLVGG
ncbi:MAG: Hsp70 family protein [Myxococcota bacterium]